MTEELEWQTRRDRINKKLQALNPAWAIIKFKENLNISSLTHHAVEEYPTANGPADYALFVKGKLLGIIEAKKVGLGPQNVLEQAKRYARGTFSGPGNLIKNLTIEKADLDYAPIFERNGGLGKARRVFDKELESLLAEINAAIAA